MSRKAKIVKVIHRYNRNTGDNVCVEHFGERVLRNVRTIDVMGVIETLAECTIKGEDVNVGLSIDGTASIISNHAWEFVYGPATEKAAANRVVSEPTAEPAAEPTKTAHSIYLHFPNGSLVATCTHRNDETYGTVQSNVEIGSMADLKAICNKDTEVMCSSSLDFPHAETPDRETWELCCEIRGNDFERLLEIVREDAMRNIKNDPNFIVVEVVEGWTAILHRTIKNTIQRFDVYDLGQMDSDGQWVADDDPAAEIRVHDLNGRGGISIVYQVKGQEMQTRTYSNELARGLKANLTVVHTLDGRS